MIGKIFQIFLTTWWSSTAVIDFVIVPSLFGYLPDVMQSGNLAIILFNKYNIIELCLGVLLFVMSFKLKIKCKKWISLGSLIVLIIALTYLFYLGPKISELTQVMSITGSSVEHDFYHSLYVKMDTVKLLILLVIQGIILIKKEDI